METSVTELIVQMISPAVMVSACGLLLLGLGNRYARLVDRIRGFAAEARELQKLGANAAAVDVERLRVLNVQIPDLFRRGRGRSPDETAHAVFCEENDVLFVAIVFRLK